MSFVFKSTSSNLPAAPANSGNIITWLDGVARDIKSPEAAFEDALMSMVYAGFDAAKIRQIAKARFPSVSILKLATIGALRGSAAASLAEDSGGDPRLHNLRMAVNVNNSSQTMSLQELFDEGYLYAEKNSGHNRKTYLAPPATESGHLTIQRIVSAFPDLAAYGLKILHDNGQLAPRVTSSLPAWMMFPAAASLPVTNDFADELMEMSKKFSELINGNFDERIYELQRAAANNTKFSDNSVHRYLNDSSQIDFIFS
jgi:hypothetical protein